MSIAAWMSKAVSMAVNAWPLYTATLAISMTGVTFATNMASTCCRPKGMALPTGTRPSSL